MAVNKKSKLIKYKWHHHENVSVAGFCWIGKKYYPSEKLALFISKNIESFDIFKETCKLLNGQFSIVVEDQSNVWISSGHTWSYPVFYYQHNGVFFVSDEPQFLLKSIPNAKADEQSKNYFLLFGVTPQNKTLVGGLCQVQAGEIIALSINGLKSASVLPEKRKQLVKKSETLLSKTILSVFDRYFSIIKERQVLLPLTAGYDSRLLACLLKKYGHKNVICATWGRKDNIELDTAKKVAKKLGFKHLFIEYNKALIEGFSQKKEFEDYACSAGHFSSMPFLQDFFAIKHLLEQNSISKETIVLPGHSGDYFAGSHLSEHVKDADTKLILSKILNKYSSTIPLKQNEFKEAKTHILSCFSKDKNIAKWQNFEQWDFQERQCKFISNSNQIYTFFGIEALTPLFDKTFIDFFESIPFEQKLHANYYNSTLEKNFFKPAGIDFNLKETPQSVQKYSFLKNFILSMAPLFLKKIYYPTNDAIFYKEITEELINMLSGKSCKHPFLPHKYNAYIIQWYINFVLQKLKSI